MSFAALVFVAGLASSPLAGDSGTSRPADALRLADVQQLVERAHEFLAEHQNPDGSFSIVRNVQSASAPVAVTGLATLSLMAGGHLPDGSERGRYSRHVGRAIEWLIDHCNDDGYFTYEGDTISKMHGQGYALLALTQAVGMYGDHPVQYQQLRDTIQRAVGLIERAQGIHGGWFYEPKVVSQHEGSITVCMIQALRAARDAGFVVDLRVIAKAEQYLERSQDRETGRFRYALGLDRTSWALTAAALATLNAAGDYGSDMFEEGLSALRRDDPFLDGGFSEDFVQYGAFYAAHTYWVYRDPRPFEAWWPRFVEVCLEDQRDDGHFPNGLHGAVYATAITSLTLQIPLGSLPIFQR